MSEKVRFDCPPNFQEVAVAEAEALLEDGDEDDQEVWLLRVPRQFNIESLDGKDIDISEWSTNQFRISKDMKYTCATSEPDELNEMTVILPNKDRNCLVATSKPLTGLCCVVRDFVLPLPKLPESNNLKLEIPDGLKARFVPFGSESPVAVKLQEERTTKEHANSPKDKEEKLHKSRKRKRHSSDSELSKRHKSPKKKKSKEKD